MPISSNLVTATQTRIDVITSSCKANDFTLAAIAATESACYDGNKKVTVPTVNDLPNIESCNIGPGHIVFVESINVPVMSYECGWMGLDRRVLRKDVLERRLWAWGSGGYGVLGTGDTTSYSSPVTTAGGGTNWCQVSGGYKQTSAVKTDGTLWVWGSNGGYDYLGTGDNNDYSSPVTVAGGGTNWRQVSSSYKQTLAIKTDGTLWAWGDNSSAGNLGTNNMTSYSSPVTTSGGGNTWCHVSSGMLQTLAIKTDGTLWTWGYNLYGELGTGNTTNYSSPVTTAGGGTTWCQASGGFYNPAAIKTDGTLWVWGNNASNQLGTGDATCYSSPVTTAGGGTNWCQVSMNYLFGGGVKTDGTLWMWGCNSNGKLGTGNLTKFSSPVTTVAGGTNWCQVSTACVHTVALKTDGTLWAWGNNFSGKLGTNNQTNYSSPVTVIGGCTSWRQIGTNLGTTSLAITVS